MINSDALAQTRTERGLSQRKFAQLVGLNYQVIARLEHGGDDGNLTLRDFKKICTTLNVDPADLLQPHRQRPKPQMGGARTDELDLGQARLLRRIQQGDDPRRSMSEQERQTVLPTLIKLGLVRTTRGGALAVGSHAAVDFAHPECLP